jgi:glucose/mannose-6-phosphate isomerase
MDTLNSIDAYLDQFDFYSDLKLPDLTPLRGINKILVCAMGGSAFPVDVVSDHLKEHYQRDIVFLSRDYNLPYWVDSDTLIVACSFSGSTEETLSCMQEAIDRKLPLLGVSMGGEISRLCSEQNIPYIALPKVLMPRFGSGYIISCLLRVVVELKLIPKQNEEVSNIKILLDPLKIHLKKTAEGMAKKLVGRIVSIYTDSLHHTAGNIAKICINETAKVISYCNIYSESNHNELASFSYTPYSHAMLLLTYPKMNHRYDQRFELLKQLLPDKDIDYEKVNSNFDQILYRDLQYIMFFTYLGYFLAIESDHDPVGTPTQDSIKKLLKPIR